MTLFNGINLGEFSSPAFADIDNDEDLDIIVGTRNQNELYVARNIGSLTNPNFEAFQTNPFGLEGNVSSGLLVPTFIDIDGDRDQDLFVNDIFGTTQFFQNLGSANEPNFASPEINPFGLAFPLSERPFLGTAGFPFAHSTFVDIDGDGDQDAFFTSIPTEFLRNGGVLFFENIGSATDPNFAPYKLNPFGLPIDGFHDIYSLSFADADGDGDFDLFSGSQAGETFLWSNIGNERSPLFNTPLTLLPDIGTRITPAFADLNNDGALDALVGEEDGTLNFFNRPRIPIPRAQTLAPYSTITLSREQFPMLAGGSETYIVQVTGGNLRYVGPNTTDVQGRILTSGRLFNNGDVIRGNWVAQGNLVYENTDPVDDRFGGGLDQLLSFTSAGIDQTIHFEINSAPTGLNFTAVPFTEREPGVLVGMLNGQDPDNQLTATRFDTFTYEIVNDPGQRFEIVGDRIQLHPDFVATDSLAGDLTIRVRDRWGLSVEIDYTVDELGNFEEVPRGPRPQSNPLSNVDVVFNSVPTFIDENNDGDLDLFVGADNGAIAVAHNQGTATNPNFANPIVIRDVGNDSAPTFADIDGDGDQDLFAGDTFGRIHYYRNRGSVNGASFAPPIINPFGITRNGGLAKPDFVDIDGDGDQDLFVGSATGIILFYRNTGTRTSPNFVRGDNNPFGLEPVVGAAAPHFVDVGNDGDFDVFMGTSDGTTRYFENAGTPTQPTFFERLSSLPDVGNNATPFLADTNGDGYLDAFIGAEDGTLEFVNGVVKGGEYPVPVHLGDGTIVLGGFQGVGTEENPKSNPSLVDQLHFLGAGLTAENLLLTPQAKDLKISFEDVTDTEVILKNFDLQNLDNLSNGIGNIVFEGDRAIQDSFDVFDADANPNQVLQPNTVTFLNKKDNQVQGFNTSNDVINGQRGDDSLDGLSGDDLLRGGKGDDTLNGGEGADILIGNSGNDTLLLGNDADIDTFIYRHGDGSDIVNQFTPGIGGDLLSFAGITAIDVVIDGTSTFFHLSDGIENNQGFAAGELLAEFRNVSEFTAENINQNLAASNTAQFLFA